MALSALLPYLPYATAAAQGLGQVFASKDMDKFRKTFKKEQQRRNLISALSEGKINLAPTQLEPKASGATKLFQGLGTAGQLLGAGLQLHGMISKQRLENRLGDLAAEELEGAQMATRALAGLGKSQLPEATIPQLPQIDAADPNRVLPSTAPQISPPPMQPGRVGHTMEVAQGPEGYRTPPAPTPPPTQAPTLQSTGQLYDPGDFFTKMSEMGGDTTVADLYDELHDVLNPMTPGQFSGAQGVLQDHVDTVNKSRKSEFQRLKGLSDVYYDEANYVKDVQKMKEDIFQDRRDYIRRVDETDREYAIRLENERRARITFEQGQVIDPVQRQQLQLIDQQLNQHRFHNAFYQLEQGFNLVIQGFLEGGETGEQRMIIGMNKIGDLESVVREGEFRITQEVMNAWQQLRLTINNLIESEGYSLNPQMRQELFDQATHMYRSAVDQHTQLIDRVRARLLNIRGMDAEFVNNTLDIDADTFDREATMKRAYQWMFHDITSNSQYSRQEREELLNALIRRNSRIKRIMGWQ